MSLSFPRGAICRVLLVLLGLASAVGAAHAAGAPEAPRPRHVVRFAADAPGAARAAVVAAARARVVRVIPALDIAVVEAVDAAGAPADIAADAGFRDAVAYVEPDMAVAVPDGAPPPAAADPVGGGLAGRFAPPLAGRLRGDRPAMGLAPAGLRHGPPNDPAFEGQWHHAAIDSLSAWEWSRGDGVTVAVVDTGVSCDVPDLVGRCVAGLDFVNGDAEPVDDQGHGTFVAGVIAAAVHNRVGGAGVAGEARVMPLKVLGASGSGAMSDVAAAVVHAADHGARVVNLSLGGIYPSRALADAVAYARDRGAVVVAAAGSENTSNPTYPAAYPGVVAVAATTPSDTRASFSNAGAWIDLAAPGVGILSATRGGGYQAWSGTSLSSAVAAGAAALLAGQDPDRDPDAIARLMLVTARDAGAPGWDTTFGAGRLDAGAAVALGQSERMPAPPVVEPTPWPTEGPPVDPPLPDDPD